MIALLFRECCTTSAARSSECTVGRLDVEQASECGSWLCFLLYTYTLMRMGQTDGWTDTMTMYILRLHNDVRLIWQPLEGMA